MDLYCNCDSDPRRSIPCESLLKNKHAVIFFVVNMHVPVFKSVTMSVDETARDIFHNFNNTRLNECSWQFRDSTYCLKRVISFTVLHLLLDRSVGNVSIELPFVFVKNLIINHVVVRRRGNGRCQSFAPKRSCHTHLRCWTDRTGSRILSTTRILSRNRSRSRAICSHGPRRAARYA